MTSPAEPMANLHLPGGEFLIVSSEHNQVRAGASRADSVTFEWVRVLDAGGNEILYWCETEWREKDGEAFEAILSVIAKVAAGEKVKKP